MEETKALYTTTPQGSPKKEIPYAELAETTNSTHLVTNKDEDAFYFRALEKEGILLNKPQLDAVRHVEGPLLTLAGAGSGKTSVLVCRTGYLISVHRIPARHILLVTFTKKAADEMKDRIASLPGLTRRDASEVQARTFHSFFLTLLKGAGFDQEILSNERYKQLIITQLLKEKRLDDSYQPETVLSLLSFYKMNLVPLDEIPSKTESEKTLKKIFTEYEKWKIKNNRFDFDDILLESYQLLKESPSLLKKLQERFRYIMVDEFQDTNLLQYELIKMIAKAHNNLFVVGDDDQTIYSFNGARNDIILTFDQAFSQAKSVTLDINYRSTSSIVGLGNQVIKHNKKRKTKTLQATKESLLTPQFSRPASTDDEAESIVQSIKERVERGGVDYRDFAILHRTASNSRAMFEQLTLVGIPFIDHSSGSAIFYEQWPVKTIISYCRLALDSRNFNAIEDILPSLYVNRQRGIEHITNQEIGKTKKKPLSHLTSLPNLKDFQKEKIRARINFIETLKDLEPLAAIKSIRHTFYDEYLDADEHENPTLVKESIKESLDELEASAKRFSTVPAFIEFVDGMIEKHKEMKGLKKEQAANAVTLMTIHRSKGLEFPIVYLIGASDGILPHSTALEAGKLGDMVLKEANREKVNAAMEEERRLCYVAITRAKKELYISSPAFYRGKKADVSTFLLHAFGKTESHAIGTVKTRVITKGSSTSSGKSDPAFKVTVLAWICTSESCNGWQRIQTQDEAELDSKDCPLCKATMEKGAKEVY